ncbi:hypothetical protein QCM80_10980 [Bradyrhizobium sp. SSUT112]|uniref:hypothetical protein n=1 Tax=Bradyrhizobium sp. SSUT112 TaxID=3040604 RepID=UPI002448D7D3|nr:hypothetical protein [Bradyrhizobium sp. SSUT112]MDH2351191.1 hypothetical protein [Bradyrhizobium sp. SSUT112]
MMLGERVFDDLDHPLAPHPLEFDTEDVLKWLLARERAERKAHTAATLKEGGEEITIDKARLRNEIAKAKLSELELATKMELVRQIDMVAKVLSNEIANPCAPRRPKLYILIPLLLGHIGGN